MLDTFAAQHPVLLAFLFTAAAGASTVLGTVALIFAHYSNVRLLALSLAFSAGAMIYISFTEFFYEASEMLAPATGEGHVAYLAVMMFFIGILLFLFMNWVTPKLLNPHLQRDKDCVEDMAAGHEHEHGHVHIHDAILLKKLGVLAALAISLHNLPEGMATFFATLSEPELGLVVAAAIALHNIPEGVSVAVPIYYATQSKKKAFAYAALSGVAEPVGALLGYIVLKPFMSEILMGMVLATIAGFMVVLGLDELLPASRRYSRGKETLIGVICGMAVMAVSLVLLH
ncbi:MAG: zinc transporter ZupT [Pseudomonadota bacterium]|nr:zinc transporter ZupT [Pseudomonadota bacterium]